MPRCVPTFDENIPLLGGASAKGARVGSALWAKTHPGCLRQPPLRGGDFQGRVSRR